MKNINKCFAVLSILLLSVACDSGFEELNTNKIDPTAAQINQVFLLNNAIVGCSYSTGQIVYDMGIVQQLVTPNSGVLSGANFNEDNRTATAGHWNKYYEGVIKHTGDIISQLSNKPEKSNLLNMTLIIQSHAFMSLTDTYGDIPYTEAGKGVAENISFPKYDTQESIYTNLISVVTNATAGLKTTGDSNPGEVLYGGDIAKWKKLGNSLLLRIGMRLSKVNPTLAKSTVATAFAGGVLSSNNDNFVVRHSSNYQNAFGVFLNGPEANNFYLVDSFVKYLAKTNDPRLGAIAIRYVGATSGPSQTSSIASKNPTVQVGMPMGNSNVTIGAVATGLGLKSFYDFSQVDRTMIAKVSAAQFILTHSQTQLLLAEAAVRGWITGDPAVYYAAGVRANMEQMGLYDANITISTAAINDYLTNNPFNSVKAMEQINSEYWVASFANGPEAFANFRRSGFPALTANPFFGQSIKGQFINRLTYPLNELAINVANVNAAISKMGPDNLDTKVWWAK